MYDVFTETLEHLEEKERDILAITDWNKRNEAIAAEIRRNPLLGVRIGTKGEVPQARAFARKVVESLEDMTGRDKEYMVHMITLATLHCLYHHFTAREKEPLFPNPETVLSCLYGGFQWEKRLRGEEDADDEDKPALQETEDLTVATGEAEPDGNAKSPGEAETPSVDDGFAAEDDIDGNKYCIAVEPVGFQKMAECMLEYDTVPSEGMDIRYPFDKDTIHMEVEDMLRLYPYYVGYIARKGRNPWHPWIGKAVEAVLHDTEKNVEKTARDAAFALEAFLEKHPECRG